ncbi:MAG: hypothetical protein EOO47_18905 [Flavobacterium sp.]|nr:MAG: hypothetical protein EOO47_18905 [Flavobacterium sp.]
MRNKKQTFFLVLVVLSISAWILKDTFSQSTVEDLKGGFKEISKYRNENNTGPIQRIYAVVVTDTVDAQLLDYGNFMPHSKYGNTKVYYFLAKGDVPAMLFPGEVNFDTKYNANCFALYEKSAMGNFGLIKNPFKN